MGPFAVTLLGTKLAIQSTVFDIPLTPHILQKELAIE